MRAAALSKCVCMLPLRMLAWCSGMCCRTCCTAAVRNISARASPLASGQAGVYQLPKQEKERKGDRASRMWQAL